MKNQTNLGHLYESLFNLGLLKALKEKINYYPYWVKEYENYPLIEYALKIFKHHRPTELLKSSLARILLIYLTQGYTFGNQLLEEIEKLNPQVLFYYGKPIPVEDDRDFYLKRFGEKFKEHLKGFTSEEKGSLLHVDLVLHLTVGKLHHIAVADLSLYGAKEIFGHYESLKNEPTYPKGLEALLNIDLKAVKNGYIFKPVNVKGGGNFQKIVEKLLKLKAENKKELQHFWSLIQFKNREVAKLIQASAYAGDYLRLLLKAGQINKETPLKLKILGITLHKVAQIEFSSAEGLEEILTFLGKTKELYLSVENKSNDLGEFAKNFTQKLERALQSQKPSLGIKIAKSKWTNLGREKILYEEWEIEDHFRLNNAKRDKHKEVFSQILKTERWIANLGVPGIGKTTTIFELFKENSLILYTSPRTFLNIDLIRRWTKDNPNLVAFYTQSEFEEVIFYHSEDENFSLPEKLIIPKLGKVKLLKIQEEDDEKFQTLSPISVDISANRPLREKGVLNRLLKTVAHLLEKRDKPLKGREIAVAFATQAVVRHQFGGTTFEHIREFLSGKENPAFGGHGLKKLLKERFLSNGIRELIFVMDEVTGSESGRSLFKAFVKEDWFNQLGNIAKDLGLNIRFALLDASLKGFEIFETFAQDEDTRPIIYIDYPKDTYTDGIISREVEIYGKTFKCLDAVGFPAKRLKLFYDFRPLEDKKEIVSLLLEALKRHLGRGVKQIFLFLQDKKLIEELNKEVLKEGLLKEGEIFTVHSLSEKRKIDKQRVRLILATSSASRGLTFPLIDTYIVVVPNFSVENNLTELVQTLFRGRGSIETEKGKETLEDKDRLVHFIFPVEVNNYEHSLARALEVANLLKASLLTVTSGGAKIETDRGEKVTSVVPVGVQRERVFHPQKEFEKRIGNPQKVLNQLVKLGGEVSSKAYLLREKLKELLQSAVYKIPPKGLEGFLKLLKEAERAETLREFFELPLKVAGGDVLTVKGHFLVLSTQLVRTEFSASQRRGYLLKLIGEIEKLEPFKSKGLKPLKEFLIKGKPLHIDLKPYGVERVLILPPLGWEFEDFDPGRDFAEDWASILSGLLYNFLGEVGNFFPDRDSQVERPFGVSDLDKGLFKEVDNSLGINVFVSREVNLFEILL